jgi:transcriptional regulator with XRE-family HTH domain
VGKRIGADKQRLARNLDEAFGAELTRLRTKGGWSQGKFADLVGYDESYMRQLERGTKSPTLRTIADIAKAVSLDASTLIRLAERRMGEKK